MITTSQIEETSTFQNLVEKDAFMRKILTNPRSKESINHIFELIKMHGSDYIKDKNFSERECKIANEILNTKQHE